MSLAKKLTEYEVPCVTVPTTMFQLRYFPPSAIRRAARSGVAFQQAFEDGCTWSFCKNEPTFLNEQEAQARCDALNAEMSKTTGERGEWFHVKPVMAVPIVVRVYRPPSCREELSSKQLLCYEEAVMEAERDFSGEELDSELDSIDSEYFGR